LSAATAAAVLTWPQVLAFRLRRQHLAARAPKEDLARVVGDICGAQAQLMSAAELQIAVRSRCTVAEVREALWTARSLVKTWLMRGTLHLARSDDLPLLTAAMSRRWIGVRPSWLTWMQVTETELWRLVDDIGDALDGTPLTREELIAVVGRGRPARIREVLKSGWGGMLKPAARNGRLCFGPSRGQSVTFVSPRTWLKDWTDADAETAIVEVGRRYLRAYGPATKGDFARWWGAWPGAGRAAWTGLADELVAVTVGAQRMELLSSDLAEVREASFDERVRLLPLFDPYLLGHATRDHLFDRAFASKVSRTAGWISAVVLVDGTVVGTWTHAVAKKRMRINVTPFEPIPPTVKKAIQARADEIAAALSAAVAEVVLAG
jgi:Winged helix DNA-binding domain